MIVAFAASVLLAQSYACAELEVRASAFSDAVMLEQSQQYCPGLPVSPADFEIIAQLKGLAFDCGGRWPGFFSSLERQSRQQADAHGQVDGDAYCRGLTARLHR